MSRTTGVAFVVAILLGFASARVEGQTVTGVVRDESTKQGIAGAFIVLLDLSGRRVHGSLSDSSGSYLIANIPPGTYRIRATRPGYGMHESRPLRVAAEEAISRDLSLTPAPVELAGIAVNGAARCEIPREEAGAISSLWNTARSALNVAAWAHAEGIVRYDVVRYSEQLDRDGQVVYRYREGQTYEVVGNPWVTVRPDDFLREGLVRSVGGGRSRFYMLDARLMLSAQFLRTHCFRLAVDESTQAVGLAFRPTRESDQPDVEGVLWLDAERRTLRSIEYTYDAVDTRTPSAEAHADYEYLPNGLWVLTAWYLTMGIDLRRRVVDPLRSSSLREPIFVRDGWQVVRARSSSARDPLWTDTVALRDMRFAAASEPDRLEPTVRIAQFSAAAIAATACSPRRYGPGHRTDIVGLVLDSSHAPIFGARVRVAEASGQGRRPFGTTDQAGVYTICGVAVGTPVTITIEGEGYVSQARTVRAERGRLLVETFELKPNS